MHYPSNDLIVIDCVSSKKPPIFVLHCSPILHLQNKGIDFEFLGTPKQKITLLCNDMFIIQIIFCVQADTVQFSNSGERKNILLFDVHKWLVC
jgi:hypothetical protein